MAFLLLPEGEMVRVGVVGATGYTGVELVRLLANHPRVILETLTSRQEAGRKVSDLFPSLRGRVELVFAHPNEASLRSCEVVFFATPNGVAMHEAPALLAQGVRVIDLSADFRLRDVKLWEQWYGMSHAAPDWARRAVYGLPELFRSELREARLVANPGCYPTAVQLGFAPLLQAGVVEPDSLIADCKSGVSGAGRKAEIHTLFAEVADSLRAYNVSGHRHLPEIEQGLARVAQRAVRVTFVPHLTPMIRGIHATLYARLQRECALQELFETFYRNERFVDVLPKGSYPETRSVRGVNVCRIAVHQPQGREMAVVLATIDNLVKGAAGQAVQNLNAMMGWPEELGLEGVALLP
ncbi:MAG: N-acetyl-gamma-glutamyl-phosphate reductase [Hydrogenophilus sp.]|nr:N-acetyl-gamma-glutamyl-phosphate reductase [Hydrogenophilus sp.]